MLSGAEVLASVDLLSATMAIGFSCEVARAGLAAEVEAWHPEALAALLDEIASAPATRRPRAVLVIAARTLPASALRQCFLARALGATVLLKPASGQEALAAALHALDDAIVPAPLSSDDPEAVAAAVARADSVVVLGGDETVAAVRALTPADKGFAGHGHKVSAAWLSDPSAADCAALAADVLAWDQAGCLAPQVAWIEGDANALGRAARRVSAAIAALEARLPLVERTAQRVARQRISPFVMMLGGQHFATETSLVMTLPDPAFRVSPGPRMLWLLPADVAAARAVAPILSTLACNGPSPIEAGPRLCPPGSMQRPPLAWHQDGLHPLASLLRPGDAPG